MSGLTEVRDAAANLLRASFPNLPRVEAFSGELTLDAAARKSLPPGVSILVAAVAAENAAEGSTLDLDMAGTFGALVVSNNAAGPEYAELSALAAAEKAALAIHGSRFGLPDVSPAVVRSLESVTDDELAGNGLSVWAVLWRQALTFTPEEESGGISDESV